MSDPARKSLLIYTGISLAAALLFLLATYATGISYPPVARTGGAVWVFILSMIITMPIVISYMNKRHI
ncbi:hypothetical protein J2Z49_001591 [Desulfofundulus luciae]|uniref:Uncharacterized protein n=1 Tax=Desulfofundulus luciae TaxID=74702 RepID=A0ABU0B2I0_9FIRM|nr:hypothetical protein [Desulfofundulus luciae]MDQ0286477.1 hypothetical protein [Desulfofundulus luciae]